MNKKTTLEMFEDIKRLETADGPKITVEDILPGYCEKVDNALQRLEAIDNANPSKVLEEIGNIDLGDNPYKTFERNKLKNVYNNEFNTIKQNLIKSQEQEKENAELKRVLEIIKEKNVNLEVLGISNNVNCYNKVIARYSVCYKELTEQEFDTLKRYFK